MNRNRLLACISITLAAATALVVGLNCSGEAGSGPLDPTRNAECESAYGARCGAACSGDVECGAGLHCETNRCAAACVPGGTACGAGEVCDVNGRCISENDPSRFSRDIDAMSGSDGALPMIDPDATCADIDVALDKTRPTVILLVDQSSSMNALAGSVTRWDAVRNSLMDPDGGVVKPLEGEVSFGIALYSYKVGDPGGCPRIQAVSPAFGNYAALQSFYAGKTGHDNTPTGDSLLKVSGLDDGGVPLDGGFALQDAGGPKIIVLATDGEPDMCTNTTSSPEAKLLSIFATKKAHQAGIRTFVIAVGTQISEAHQREVANAGAGLPIDAGGDAAAKYYRTNDPASLNAAFREIITSQRSCKFALRGEVVAGTEDRGVVKLSGGTLTRNAPDGWRLNGNNEVEVLGAACNTVKTAVNADLSVRFPCGSIVNIPSNPR